MLVRVISSSYVPKFAWLPTRMECGRIIWLRTYQSINGGKRKRLYAKIRKHREG